MVSDRPYRAGLPHDAAVQELRDNSGTQFDPLVVTAFLEVLADRGALTPPELRVLATERAAEPSETTGESHTG
jgi:HD-GYP domain-containing protein (c-di-GMP phosphodiesterase class II)